MAGILDFGKSSSNTNITPTLSDEQKQTVDLQNRLASETIIPTIQQGIKASTDIYNNSAPGVTNAGQNLAGRAAQVGQTTGETGESLLRTSVNGLQSLFSPEYAQEQLNAAMAPGQAQYMQNLANQQAQFGGTGNLGSARQALAGQQLAGQTQATQAATAANILKDIQAQRLQAASTGGQLGQSLLGQSLGAAGTGLGASQAQMDYINKMLSGGAYGAPAGSYGIGPYGSSNSGSGTKAGINI
jgi:hypothetical protein